MNKRERREERERLSKEWQVVICPICGGSKDWTKQICEKDSCEKEWQIQHDIKMGYQKFEVKCSICGANHIYKTTSKSQAKKALCSTCRASKSEAERLERKAASEAESARYEFEKESLKNWRGVKRTANMIVNRLNKAGFEYERHDALSGSIYITIEIFDDFVKLRCADHEQVRGGGFNEATQERSGEADFDIYPEAGKAADDAIFFTIQKSMELGIKGAEWDDYCEKLNAAS